MSKGKMTRREEREQAFILVFQQLINRNTIEEIIDASEESAEIRIAEFAEQLASGVEENSALVDDKIEKNIRGWSMARLSKVSFALLRVSIYEMMFIDSIPVSVSINEAVDLAKKYGGADDASFINGVLGSVAKELEPENEEG
ncbi:transcription antitermination factor NusB [Faecalispora anaeroviscerum]|uniref:transcription antitermination factor NusB n=1 Tax=Faecalispora anaeroviscerum TaxID=2991836 RepID=UPI0024B9E571|nr:transcription antitermination factor NusB [Faecalispora anaeroviscerum]